MILRKRPLEEGLHKMDCVLFRIIRFRRNDSELKLQRLSIYIVYRCCNGWKDIKIVDTFYIVLILQSKMQANLQ